MHLYDRACRKFKQNKILWKEYLEYLVRTRSLQKLNRVVSQAVQVHPDTLDFWLVGAYSELDLKGNLFSSRNLMRSALRANESVPKFYTAYLEFEVKFLDKLMQRRGILQGQQIINQDGTVIKKDKDLEFIDDEEAQESDIEGEVKKGEEANIVKIVVDNLLEKFPNDITLLKEVKQILKQSKHIDPSSTLMKVKEAYSGLKERDPLTVIELYKGREITLEILSKGLKRVNASNSQELRSFFLQAAIDMLKNNPE